MGNGWKWLVSSAYFRFELGSLGNGPVSDLDINWDLVEFSFNPKTLTS